MKKIFYWLLTITLFFLIGVINIFLEAYSNKIHIVGINIILTLNFLILIICNIIINNIFKKSNLINSKNFRMDLKNLFSNAFVKSSIISIVLAFLIYEFLGKILSLLGLENGYINYCVFVSKIWFISSPFIGLEILIFKYFTLLDYYYKPILIILLKLILYLLICFLLYSSRKVNCFIYAKPLCDIIFLIYYSRICFDITLKPVLILKK